MVARPKASGFIGISAGGETHDIGFIGISAGGQIHDILVYWNISWWRDLRHPGLLVYQLADRPMTSGLIGISAGGQTHDILIYWYICWRRDPWHPEILVYQLADRPTTSGFIGISISGFICLSSYTTDFRWPYHLDYIQRIVYSGKWAPKSRERPAWLIDFPLHG